MIHLDVRREGEFEGVQSALADAAETVARLLSGHGPLQAYAPPGADVTLRVVIGGPEQAARWDVAPEALGFFAIMTQERYDEDDVDEEDPWYDVNEAIEAHVNVHALAAAVSEDWAGDHEAGHAAEVEAALVTVAHEAVHALEWIRQTDGLTPLQVFDAGPGQVALRRTVEAIEAARPAGTTEDDVEELARSWTAGLLPRENLAEWVDAIDAHLSRAPSPR